MLRKILVLVAFVVLASCKPADTPREQARAVVLSVAEGVRIGDQVCAAYAVKVKDLQMAEVCAALVAQARQALITAEDGVDLWGAAEAKNIPCAVKSSVEILGRLSEELKRAGAPMPPAVEDALLLAPILVGACKS